jgi:hypothetical protein
MTVVRELRVTDIRCHDCGAGPGDVCAGVPRAHASRMREFSELVRDGWEWQEVALDDNPHHASKRIVRCAVKALCVRPAGHTGACDFIGAR